MDDISVILHCDMGVCVCVWWLLEMFYLPDNLFAQSYVYKMAYYNCITKYTSEMLKLLIKHNKRLYLF